MERASECLDRPAAAETCGLAAKESVARRFGGEEGSILELDEFWMFVRAHEEPHP
ncbi:hypothetical protein [Brevundimonas halotolerans]|uniref:Uncharacterized protein n=1 Tax=Brevundimonas halotolerans TaxID=69670 RepID=A0A7W9E8M9_9CAUL|nr:hypothetical protein [Brevundimonas halotolerans]MBB5661134.1 hypothetical protein [Brevundimonas halotolerans]